MKVRTKNSSKNLGDSMRRGLTKSTQQNSNLEKGKDDTASTANCKETRIGEELTELDTASFESILKDAIDHPVWNKKDAKALDHSKVNPVIMGLIDGAKQRQTTEKGPNESVNTKAPVKFDDVIDFIDDGVEEIVVGKPPALTANILSRSPNIKSPIRGNPVTDFDKMHEMNGNNGENAAAFNQDTVSLMEMGHHKMVSSDEPKLKGCQKNVKCDEKEQLDYMREKGLNDYAKFDTVLGPASQGEFASFAQNLTPVIASELGVLNPVNTNTYNIFQTCTTNGRLLPAIPRKYFCTTENHPRPTHRPSPSKPPVTIMLQTAAPSFLNTSALTDTTMSGLYSSSLSAPSALDIQGAGESANAKKRKQKAAKKAAAKAADEKNSVESDLEDEEEKENEEGLTEKERDARRRRNMKNKERKKAKKMEEKKEMLDKTVEVPEETVNSARAAENQDQETTPDVLAHYSSWKTSSNHQPEMELLCTSATPKQHYALDQLTESDPPPRPPARLRNRMSEESSPPQQTISNRRQLERFLSADQLGIAEKMNFCKILGLPPWSLFTVGTGSPEESPKNQQNNSRRAIVAGGGGKNKKNDKGVSSEYTVGSNAKASKKAKDPSADREDIGWIDESVGSQSLEEILKDLGIDVSESTEKPKKNKKGANNNTSKKASKQQKKEHAAKETARSPPSDNELSLDDEAEKSKKQSKKKMDEVAVAASITKRSSSGVGQSEEDDDQSYVSAQENLGGSTSRLSTPPAEFVDARQSRDEISENVMLDPNNYRDDEDVESLAIQLQQQEDEFITVGKNKKKNKKQAFVQDNAPASSTASSSSPPNRRNSTTGQAASAVSPSGNNQFQQHHQHQRNNNRPVAHPTTLGDFMESTKKDTHKNIKHKKVVSPINTSVQKKQISLEEPTPSSPAFVDALETPISVNTAPTFSYADAAKKSSGENTPAHEMSPVPQSAKSPLNHPAETSTETKKIQEAPTSHVSPKFVSTTKSSAVQLPASSAAVADSDISFGYEETLDDKRRREQKEAQDVELPGGRTSASALLKHFAQNAKEPLNKMPKNGSSESNVLANEIVLQWHSRWNSFNSGPKPVLFKSLQKK